MDWRWLAVRGEHVLGVLATCTAVLPASGWPVAPRPWPAWAAYGWGLAVILVTESPTPRNFCLSEGFAAGVSIFFAMARIALVVSSIVIRGALTKLQLCLLTYCRAHPMSSLGFGVLLATVLITPLFMMVVVLLLIDMQPFREWGAAKAVDLFVGVQWAATFSLTLLPKALIGAQTSDLREECGRLMSEAPYRSGSHAACCRWRSMRMRQQHLHDLSAATTAIFQWRLLALLVTTVLYASLQMSDFLVHFGDPVPAAGPRSLAHYAQVLDCVAHFVCCIILFVVYRWEDSESQKIGYMLMGYQAELALYTNNRKTGLLREITLFVKQIRFQKYTSNILSLFDLDYCNMMRIISASFSYLVVMFQFGVHLADGYA